jgi:diguanylate cyclase (GGDEF)-like protein
MPDPARPSISDLIRGKEGLLRDYWRSSVAGIADRMGRFLRDDQVFAEVRGLLVDLVGLVERPGSPEQAVDIQIAPILEHLKALQDKHSIGTTDMAFILFSMKDILDETFREAVAAEAPDQAGKRESISYALNQISLLLNRLGLVFFESDMRAREGEGFQQDVLAIEYALLYERTLQVAITDQLTGLYNFGYFRDRLREERARATRTHRLLSLILFDIDHFKMYNDTNGHPAGNDVLKRIARVLREEAGELDVVARYGGEEMAIILPESSRKEAFDLAERIRRRVESTTFPRMESQPGGRLTLSAGVATYPVDAASSSELIRRADESLYAAKRAGRNRTVAYDPPHKVRLLYRPYRPVQAVALVGSFNNWDKDTDPMQPREDGTWQFVISLNPGTYQYKFVLDGHEWVNDPANPERTPHTLGGANSLLRVVEASKA